MTPISRHVRGAIIRWLAAARVGRDGVPAWQVDLGYIAGMTHYHASEIDGFKGTTEDWLRHLVDNVPDEPFIGLRQELQTQLDSGVLVPHTDRNRRPAATVTPKATPHSRLPITEAPKATAPAESQGKVEVASENDLDDWLDSL